MKHLIYSIILGFLSISCNSDKKPLSIQKDKQPNIMLIIVDDMGYSDLGCFGGEINTPQIDKLAETGLIITDFYVSPMCAPTRGMLMTGVDNHQNGMGEMPPFHKENQYLKDGYEGYMNNRVITIPEILRKHDYHTYMSGKWHLGAFDTNYYPSGRGFERSFAMMGGGSGFYQNAFPLAPMEKDVTFYVRDKNKVEELPDDFYSTKAFTDEMIKYIKEQKDDKPFFSYLAYTAPHDPLHAPAEYIEKYKGVYDNGYSAIKTKRLTQMKSKGLINKSMPSNPGTGKFPDWESLSEKEQKSQARKMEIYAAMIDYMDNQIGRVIDALKEEDKYDNTIFIVMSDNGANPKEAIFYFLGDQELFSSQGFDNSFENMGKTNSFVSQGGAWAEVSETPFTYFKTTTGEGGIRAPLIISGAGIETTGIHNATMHVTDILPTILSFAKVKRPKTYKNKELKPLYGQSAASFLKGESSIIRDTESKPICFELGEHKAVIKGEWKALMLQPPYTEVIKWELFNLKSDPTEKTDVSASNPQKLEELIKIWNAYSKKYGYIEGEGEMQIKKIGAKAFYEFK